jgi:hypothetical protein
MGINSISYLGMDMEDGMFGWMVERERGKRKTFWDGKIAGAKALLRIRTTTQDRHRHRHRTHTHTHTHTSHPAPLQTLSTLLPIAYDVHCRKQSHGELNRTSSQDRIIDSVLALFVCPSVVVPKYPAIPHTASTSQSQFACASVAVDNHYICDCPATGMCLDCSVFCMMHSNRSQVSLPPLLGASVLRG